VRRPAAAAPRRAGEPEARVRRSPGDRTDRRHRLGARAAPDVRAEHGDGARAHRRPPGGRAREQLRGSSAARSTPCRATRPRASCNSARRIACRWSRCATRPATWSAPRPRRRRSCATAVAAVRDRREPHGAVLHDRPAQGYGLGAQAMAAAASTPVLHGQLAEGEFGAMNLEGAVRLGLRKRARGARPTSTPRREALRGTSPSPTSAARRSAWRRYLELDDVIDPADTRARITRGLIAMPVPAVRARRFLDTW
jgi:hypothetical protein